METMYWIDVLGNISTTASILAGLSMVVLGFALSAMISTWAECDDDDKAKIKKWVKRIGVCAALFTLTAVFTPSTKSMYLICGVGGTIDYLKENETAKQLPDKVVMALDKWVDSQIEDENKDKDK